MLFGAIAMKFCFCLGVIQLDIKIVAQDIIKIVITRSALDRVLKEHIRSRKLAALLGLRDRFLFDVHVVWIPLLDRLCFVIVWNGKVRSRLKKKVSLIFIS